MPIINDIVTLYRNKSSDTRTWDGSNWVRQDKIIDGSLLVTGSILGSTIAANTLTADNIQANAVSARAFASDSIVAGVIDVEQAAIKNSLQIGVGNITFSNLSSSLTDSFSSSYSFTIPTASSITIGAYIPHMTGQTFSFTRNFAVSVEQILVNLSSKLSIHVRRTASSRPSFRRRADQLYSFNAGIKIKIGRTLATAVTVPSNLTNLRPQIYSNKQLTAREDPGFCTSFDIIRFCTSYLFLGHNFNESFGIDRPSNTLPLSLSPMNIQNQIFIEYYFNQSPATLSYDVVSASLTGKIVIQETRPFG